MGGFVSCTAPLYSASSRRTEKPHCGGGSTIGWMFTETHHKRLVLLLSFLLDGGFVFLFVSLSACDLFLCFRFPFLFSFARRDPAPVLSINTSSSFLSAFSSFFPCSLDAVQFLFFWGAGPDVITHESKFNES